MSLPEGSPSPQKLGRRRGGGRGSPWLSTRAAGRGARAAAAAPALISPGPEPSQPVAGPSAAPPETPSGRRGGTVCAAGHPQGGRGSSVSWPRGEKAGPLSVPPFPLSSRCVLSPGLFLSRGVARSPRLSAAQEAPPPGGASPPPPWSPLSHRPPVSSGAPGSPSESDEVHGSLGVHHESIRVVPSPLPAPRIAVESRDVHVFTLLSVARAGECRQGRSRCSVTLPGAVEDRMSAVSTPQCCCVWLGFQTSH